MEDKIMRYETTNSSKYRRAFSFLLILLFTVQLVLFSISTRLLQRRIVLQDLRLSMRIYRIQVHIL
mgnify:CR=1 FL=1